MLTLAGPDRGRRGAEVAELGIIRDGAVLIGSGAEGDGNRRILAVGTMDEVGRKLRAGGVLRRESSQAGPGRRERVEEVDCRSRLLAPGWVDAHTHPMFVALRLEDFARRTSSPWRTEGQAAGGGIAETARFNAHADDAALLAASMAHLRRMRRWGTTTVEIKTGYGLTPTAELRQLRFAARAVEETGLGAATTLLAAHALPAEHADRRAEYVRGVCEELLPAARAAKSPPEFVDVFCDAGAFTLDECRTIGRAAAALGFGLKVHAEQHSHTGAARWAAAAGAVSADHLECSTAEDHRALAESDCVAVLLPGCDLFLGTAYAPARPLLAAGAIVALATDFNPGTSPIASMPLVLSLACAQMKMSPAEAWTAATVNAAAAVGRAKTTGSLTPGKRGDVALYAADDYRAIPYSVGENLCLGVAQDGIWMGFGPSSRAPWLP